MRRLLMGASALPLVMTLLVGWGASAEPPADPASYNTFDAVTINDEEPLGTEVPYTGSAEFQYLTPSGQLDTAAFSVEPGEFNADSTNHNGCLVGAGQAAFAGRTAWVRFDPDVDGQLLVRAITPGYDSVLVLHEVADRAWGQVDLSHLSSNYCDASQDGPGNEEVGACTGDVPCVPAEAGSAYYIQVGGRCPSSTDPSSCTDPSVPGGPTRIEVRFVPDDSDGDGVPDTTDTCPGTAEGIAVNSVGCPDQDGDEVADADDECPTIAGNPDLAGCPDGPTPPPGVVGVVILSDSGNTFTTPDNTVRLRLVWPQGATHFIASNNGGDYSAPQPVAATVPWTLQGSSFPVTRQVSVKYRGNIFDPENQYTSSTLLDPDAPKKDEALVVRTWDNRFAVALRLDDGQGSGVRIVRLGGQTFGCRPAKSPACRHYRLQRQFRTTVSGLKAVDYAGNGATFALARARCQVAGQLPVYRYPQYRGTIPYGCFSIGQTITRRQKSKHDFPSVNLRTPKVRPGVFRVRKG